MGALRIDPLEIGRALRVNERFGALLQDERRKSGHSLPYISKKFGLNPYDLQMWELGLTSPPAKVFYAIVKFYGSDALERAAYLDLELQMKKYEFVTQLSKSNSVILPTPSMNHQLIAA
ncbi:MAG: hypothetical protein AB7H97_15300 [Pseudobdellovibrionaceae bacterium]